MMRHVVAVFTLLHGASALCSFDGGGACYLDGNNGNEGPRALAGSQNTHLTVLTWQGCMQMCFDAGFAVAGVENGNQCYCDHALKFGTPKAPSMARCATPCAGAAKNMSSIERCGGSWALNVFFNVSCAGPKAPTPAPPAPPPLPPAPHVTPCYENSTLARLPYCSTSLQPEARARDLVARMTLDEKVRQLDHGGENAVPRLGVARYQYHSEGLHGVRTACKDMAGVNTTLFPQVVGMAATGNLSLIRAMAAVMSTEARALNNLANGTVFSKGAGLNYWGPTMNIGRDPRWGRFQESVSECPWLNGAYAAEFVAGMQVGAAGGGEASQHVKIAACCKHYYAYSLENWQGFTRHNFDARVSARDLAETYLPAFRACAAAGVEQVMCSYNAVNGVPTCLDHAAQNGVLRGEFGFKGMIVSDCGAIEDAWKPTDHAYAANASAATAIGVQAGCDMNCGSDYGSTATAAVQSGALSLTALDAAVARPLAMRIRLGEFDASCEYRDLRKYGAAALDTAAARRVALQAAEESIVLLRNDGAAVPGASSAAASRPLLPLDTALANATTASPLRVAVLGPMADTLPNDKGDYCPASTVTVLQGLRRFAEALPVPDVLQVQACGEACTASPAVAAAAARGADVVLLCLGGGVGFGGEGQDWSTALPSGQLALAQAVHEANPAGMVAVLVHGNPFAMDWLAAHARAIVETFEGGQAAGTALARMLFGTSAVAPSGVLPWTVYPDNYTSLVSMTDMNMRAGPGRTYRFYSGPVTFPFGAGLTYTSFALAWAQDSEQPQRTTSVAAAQSAPQRFVVRVTNTGARAGAKVVAAYVSFPTAPDVPAPPRRQLFAMQKVALAPGASADVELASDALAGYCSLCTVDSRGAAAVRPGNYTITVGDAASTLLTMRLLVR